LLLAFFDSEAAAGAAVDALKKRDKATKEIKLGGVGVLWGNHGNEANYYLMPAIKRLD
jgi:hypothetical protein